MSKSPFTGSTRRAFVKSTLAVAVASQLSHAAPAAPFAVPEVDSLALQVLVDNATFGPFLPDLNLPGLKLERIAGKLLPRMSRQALMGEFGLSLLARSQRGSQTRSVMVDFGYSPEVLANNLAILGIDTSELNAAVLSHGHLDHYGGFTAVFGKNVPAKHLPLIVGGEDFLRAHGDRGPGIHHRPDPARDLRARRDPDADAARCGLRCVRAIRVEARCETDRG
jgi:7,8-dihydropterin-6-yl-methyl-4-(beta-D-ribofuranosyl)aminobenzene 5'-phosphate synthase